MFMPGNPAQTLGALAEGTPSDTRTERQLIYSRE
jgi:hypothetical protein